MPERRNGSRRGPGRVVEKPHNLKKAMSDLLRYCRNDMGVIIIALILSMSGAVLNILGPRQISHITDQIAGGLSTGINMPAIARVGFILIGLYGCSSLFTFLQHYLMAGFNQRLSKRMRGDIVGKINRLKLSYFNFHEHGDVLSRVTNDVDTISSSLSNSLATLVSSAAQFVGCLVMMVITNWIMAGTSVFSTFLAFLLMMTIVGRSQKYFVARQKNLGNLNGYIEEMYTGHDIIRTSNADRKVKEEFDRLNNAVRDSNFKSQFLGGLMHPLMGFIGNFGYVAVCVVGAALAMNGTSKINNMKVVAKVVNINLTKNAKLTGANVTSEGDIAINADGKVAVDMECAAENLLISASGSSDLNLNVKVEKKVDQAIAGSSKTTLSGSSESLVVNGKAISSKIEARFGVTSTPGSHSP